jgi:hypothetical protein
MAEHIYPNEEELFAEVNEGHLSWSVRQMRGTAPRSPTAKIFGVPRRRRACSPPAARSSFQMNNHREGAS